MKHGEEVHPNAIVGLLLRTTKRHPVIYGKLLYELGGMIPGTLIKGSMPDISRLVEHEWYDWVKFRDVVPSFPNTNEVLGRWLRPSTDIGSEMCYHILKRNGTFFILDISRSHRHLQ